MMNSIEYRDTKDLPLESILQLYCANQWSAAEKPQALHAALKNSDAVLTAWRGEQLIGLANAISDGHLVVYYPHVCVLPEFHGQGIGRELMRRLLKRYEGFHQHTVVADKDAIPFFKKCGFVRAGQTEPLWIFAGSEH